MMQSTLAQSLAAMAAVSTFATAAVVPSAHAGNFPPSAHRRHHARMQGMAKRNISPRALLSNTGFGTLYYDINGGGTCGPVNGWSSFPETQGYAMCEPWTGPKTLAQRGTNKIVALPVSMMSGNLDKYCGKEVTATWNGRTVSGLIAWDGCAACDSGSGIDFSSTVFGELVGTDNCGAGKVQGVTWEVKENSIWDRNGNPVSGNSYENDKATTSEFVSDIVVEPSTSSSSSSSSSEQAVTRSSSSSSSEQAVTRSSSSTQERSSPISTREWSNDDSNANKKIANMRLPILAAKPTASSSSSSSSTSSSESSGQEQTQSTEKAAVAEPASTATATIAAASDACNDTPGQWKCNGKALQQCVQSGNNWVWNERFECSVTPINCDTSNPVCPGKAVSIKKLRL